MILGRRSPLLRSYRALPGSLLTSISDRLQQPPGYLPGHIFLSVADHACLLVGLIYFLYGVSLQFCPIDLVLLPGRVRLSLHHRMPVSTTSDTTS